MSGVSPRSTANPLLPSSYSSEISRSNDTNDSDVSDHGARDFTYDFTEQPRDPWPGQVQPRRRSTVLSSQNQPAAMEENRASNPWDNARSWLSRTAALALKEKVPLPTAPWKQKRSSSQSANSRTRTHVPGLSTLHNSPALSFLSFLLSGWRVIPFSPLATQRWTAERNSSSCSRKRSSPLARRPTAWRHSSSPRRTSC